jgi:hypothetical protein
VPAAGTELAVKAKKKQGCRPSSGTATPLFTQNIEKVPAARSSHTFTSHSSHLFLLARGQGDVPPAALVRRIASLMQGATDYHHLIDCWSVAMWSSSCPLRALRVGVLSPPCESSDRQFTRNHPCTALFDSSPGEVSSADRLQPGFLM